MKITLFIGGLSGGGAERVCCNLANYLNLNNHSVTILTMGEDTSSYCLEPNIERIVLLKNNEKKNFFYNSILRYKRLFNYVQKSDSDVILVMLPITILVLLTLKPFTSAKIIASERNMPTLYSRIEQCLLKYFARFAEGWVFQTEVQKEWYGDVIKSSIVIPNAVNSEIQKIPYTGQRERRIVTAGRLSAQKNHKLLITAFSRVADKFPDIILEIYGQGPMHEELVSMVCSIGLRDRVKFMGFCKNLSEEIKNASLFVLSSDFEGIPNVLIEAMAVGLPCVSTDTQGGGARLLIENGENGLLVPIGDVDQLSSAMITLLENPEYANKLGISANSVVDRFSAENIYSVWEKYLTSF